MQVLSNALPGMRDLRAPVVAGYLWLLAAFVVFTPSTSSRPSGDTAAALYDLAADLGRIPLLAAMSVAAYLVGALSQEIFPSVARWIIRKGELFKATRRAQLPPRFTEATERSQSALVQLGAQAQGAPTGSHQTETYARFNGEWNTATDAAERAIRRELGRPALLLVGEKEQLFAEVDRLEAEADFRQALVPPMCALSIVAAATLSVIWLCLLVGAGLLLRQGLGRRADAQSVMRQAIDHGAIASSALTEYEQWSELFTQRARDALSKTATT